MTNDKGQMTRPLPEPVEELNKQYWAFCNEERLCFQHCVSCGNWQHIPRYLCARCGSDRLEWQQASGRGKVYSWTVTRAPLHPAFAASVPYAVLLVELAEGVRMISGLKGNSVDEIELDMPVEVIFERLTADTAMPFFQRVKE